MGVALTIPTPGDIANNGTWGATLVTAFGVIQGADVYKIKTADESVTSSTTLQDDDHLAAATLGVGTWIINALFLCSGAAAGDIKIAWAHSGTFTGYRGGVGPSSGVSSVLTGATAGTRTAAANDTTAVITGAPIYAVDGTNWTAIQESGILVVTVSGTFKIQWAQGASSGTATILRQGSYFWARQVA